MKIEDLGYNHTFEEYRQQKELSNLMVGRVTLEHRDRYEVVNQDGEFDAEVLGNLRFTAQSKNDLPAVGDWVAISAYDEGKVLIHAILPRYSKLERQAIGKFGEKQIIAANIDYGLIVQSINRDFNLNRIERYLTLCYSSKIKPIIVITKIDLTDNQNLQNLLSELKSRAENVPTIAVSNETKQGIDELKHYMVKAKTYCLLGSSGVGKSSLINSLSGQNLMKTAAISESIDRGKHITTHRELIPMVNGALLIDNPGMREVGVTESTEGIENTFEKIYALAKHCKFKDCTHTAESGCAVLNAVKNGDIDENALKNFYKIENEQAHFSSTIHERRSKDKNLGKIYREGKKFRKNHKY